MTKTNKHYLFENSKHLEGIELSSNNANILKTDKKKTKEKLKIQMEKYGVSQYSAYNLEYDMYVTLYVQLKNYLMYADKIIDLTYHKMDYLDSTYTQIEMINMLLERLKEAIEFDFYDYNELTPKEFNDKLEYFKEVYDMYKVVSHYLTY